MATVDQYDVDAARNTKNPPYGAPELGLSWANVSDTFRSLMAAAAELREQFKTLKALAFQPADAIAVTGGTIKNVEIQNALIKNSSVEGLGVASPDATKVYGLTKQQFFDMVYPIAEEVIRKTPPGWPGTTSQWALVHGGRYLRASAEQVNHANAVGSNVVTLSGSTGDAGGTAGGTATITGTTGQGGSASGTTGGRALTVANMPAEVVTDTAATTDAPSKLLASGSDRGVVEIRDGGGQAHDHSFSVPQHTHTFSGSVAAPAVPAHRHGIDGSLTIEPAGVWLNVWRRIA